MADALGLIETRGFVGVVEAANAMLKAAAVELVGYEKVGGGFVTAVIRGPLDEGAKQAERVGELVSVHVIEEPHPKLGTVLPLGK